MSVTIKIISGCWEYQRTLYETTKLTQRRISELFTVDQSHVSRLVSGERRVSL